MEIILDTANIAEIKKYSEILTIAGVTTNPSICKKEKIEDFWNHMNKIRSIIGQEKSLHIQVVANDYEGMIKDAETILTKVDKEVFVKVPTTEEGLKVMKELKRRGYKVTATAIYTKMQAYLAINSQVDYLAPYYNRMENQNINANKALLNIANIIDMNQNKSKILAASFKNIGQVTNALESGAHSVTISTELLKKSLTLPSIHKAVFDFSKDWESLYGKGQTISDL